jgi:hypothetical protein
VSRLFDISKVTGEVANVEIDSFSISEDLLGEEVLFAPKKMTPQQVLPNSIKPSILYSCLSSGLWDHYTLVDHILTQTGQGSTIHLATWSISELSARKLVDWIDSGRVAKVFGVLDYRSKNRHPAAFHLASNVFSDIKIDYCHAKVTVICSPNGSLNPDYITICGSANWTQNPRKEACTILNSKKTAMAHIDWINQVITKGEYGLE